MFEAYYNKITNTTYYGEFNVNYHESTCNFSTRCWDFI